MTKVEILDSIKNYLKESSFYDQRGFEVLYTLQGDNLSPITKDTCLCTPNLEIISHYARIIDDLTEEEKQELTKLIPSNRVFFLECLLQISAYCQKLIEQFEEEEIRHPVLEIYNCYDFLFHTKDNYQRVLAEYLDSLPTVIKNEVMTNQLLIENLSETYLKELFQYAKQEFAKAVYHNDIEASILVLRDYSLIKEMKYNGTDKMISYYDSEIMKCLYNYNQPHEDSKYAELESYYLSNKNYYSYYVEMHRVVNKYKEYCKKL